MSYAIEDFKENIRKSWFLKKPNKSFKTKASRKIASILSSLPFWIENQVVASYCSLPSEISPDFFENKLRKNLCFVFPKVLHSRSKKMVFSCADKKKPKDWQTKGRIPEPFNKASIPLNRIDIFLVPGVAFDRDGHRLGRGGGHYDRVLFQASGLKIGLAYTTQIKNSALPVQSHDIQMDLIATEQFVFVPLNKKSPFLSYKRYKRKASFFKEI